MSFIITLTDGQIFATIPDGTINTTSSMTLVGKNYAGYGQFINDNIIRLLENGSNTTAPTAPLTGQLWWDITTGTMKVYTGSTFKVISGATASATEPTVSNIAGDLWYDSVNAQLNVYSGTRWILVGPAYTGNTGVSGAIVTTITDTGSVPHVAVEMYVANAVVGIFSKDAAYIPAVPPTGGGWAGGKSVQPGLTMSGPISGVTPLFQGTATTATTATTASIATTANAVAGANVSGAVALATTATTVAGANVSGTVALATTAVNVSGIVDVVNGGTSATTLAANNVLLGNNTSTLQTVAPGTSGNVLTSNGSTWQSIAIPAAVPTGTISMWPTSTPPTGWLLANGSDVSRTVYADLFAVIGATFGTGSPSTFTLPNFTNQFPVGAGNLYAVGATGGSKDAVVVSHTHGITENSHRHLTGVGAEQGLNNKYGDNGSQGTGWRISNAGGNGVDSYTNSVLTGITVNSAGNSGTNANLPPYLGIRFIIKT